MKYFFSIFIALFLIACSDGTLGTNDLLTNQDQPISSEKLNDINVYFSTTSGDYNGGVDEKIVADINSSKTSINLAIYEFTNRKIKDALIDAFNRGVDVRVITDDKQYEKDYNMYDELEDAGVSIKTDVNFANGLMHNKFLIIDSKVLWSGSGNYTYYSFYRNYENYVRVTNSNIIEGYKDEFNEMQNEHLEAKIYTANGYELYFSPEDNFRAKRLINLVDSAKKSLYIMAFALNDEELKDAIIRAFDRGVEIHIVFDKEQTEGYQKDYTQYYTLKDAGVDVVLVGDSTHKMHNKVIIVDSELVLTGSYNFTVSANEDNCENELIVKDSSVASRFIEDFREVYKNE